MHHARALTLLLAGLALTGCKGPLDAFWIGDVRCAAVPYDIEFTLERDAGKVYQGSGEQERVFTATTGLETTEIITFDVTVELDKAGGAQDLETDMVCTSEQKVVTRPGGGDPEIVSQGCTPLRYRDWTLAWDGEDGLTISDPDGCSGELVRRGD